ncbi:hypothetical protein ACHQM5_019731 [Ranunculus cassubicifolius]
MEFYCNSPSTATTSSSSSSSSDITFTSSTVTHKRNAGRKKFKETRHPIYRGVRKRNGSKWVCEIRAPNKKTRVWLGTHETAEMAARAYDVASIALRGKSAPLNFADSAWLLPRPKSTSAVDIRATAYQAAQAFAPIAAPSLSLLQVKVPENILELSRIFWDDEAMLNMPCLIDSMAEALLLTPPCMLDLGDVNWDMNMSLWD